LLRAVNLYLQQRYRDNYDRFITPPEKCKAGSAEIRPLGPSDLFKKVPAFEAEQPHSDLFAERIEKQAIYANDISRASAFEFNEISHKSIGKVLAQKLSNLLRWHLLRMEFSGNEETAAGEKIVCLFFLPGRENSYF
jgi:hypothetical protein